MVIRTASLAGLLTALVMLCACGSASTTSTATSASPAPTSATPTSSAEGLPVYRPSALVSKTSSHVQLTTPSSVSQVTAFYDKALKDGGWTTTSSSTTMTGTNITAHRGNTGTTLAISAAGSAGTSISISTYHV